MMFRTYNAEMMRIAYAAKHGEKAALAMTEAELLTLHSRTERMQKHVGKLVGTNEVAVFSPALAIHTYGRTPKSRQSASERKRRKPHRNKYTVKYASPKLAHRKAG